MAQSYLALPEDGLTVFEGAVPIKSTWASEGVGKRVSEMGAGYSKTYRSLFLSKMMPVVSSAWNVAVSWGSLTGWVEGGERGEDGGRVMYQK